jgi:hypothetical protein
MLHEFRHEIVKERVNGELAAAERRRLEKLAPRRGVPLRARLARRLFGAAVLLDRGETWNEVWDRLEARGRL